MSRITKQERHELRQSIAEVADALPDYILTLNTALCELRDASRGKRRKEWASLSRRMVHAGKVWKLCNDIERQLSKSK